MTSALKSPYTREQMSVWLQGLLTVAWADGDFDEEEQKLILNLTQDEIAPSLSLEAFQPLSSDDLAKMLGTGEVAENFLRTAVMVALADGVYSHYEDQTLQRFCQALDLDTSILEVLRSTLYRSHASGYKTADASAALDPLKPVREWLDHLDIEDPRLARFLCKLIPPQCPFERDIVLFGHKIVHIPPMCKLNPLYEQLVGLRFRALSYLADDCGEDISAYV